MAQAIIYINMSLKAKKNKLPLEKNWRSRLDYCLYIVRPYSIIMLIEKERPSEHVSMKQHEGAATHWHMHARTAT